MTILTAGGEMGAGIPSDGSVYELTSSYYDAAFSRASIRVIGSDRYFECAHFAETAEVFFHGEYFRDSSGGATHTVLTFYDGSDLAVYRMTIASDTHQMQYLASDNVTWTNIGSTFTMPVDTQNIYDIRLKSDASGVVAVYSSGTLRVTGSADTSHIGGVAYYRASAPLTSGWSQMIVADESTIGWRLKTVPVTGAGATADWTGTFAEVDEALYSDADFVNSSTNDQVELFTHSTTIPTGYRVKAAVVTARAKRGSSGPANLQLAVRSSGTNYYSASKALDLGYGAFTEVWEDDPATAAAFTASAISTLQFGVRAKT